jgi:ankyrin repeat protein
MVASESGNLKAAALLLEAGASLSVRDYEGKTPLCCAGSEKIKTMLEEMELAEINGQA